MKNRGVYKVVRNASSAFFGDDEEVHFNNNIEDQIKNRRGRTDREIQTPKTDSIQQRNPLET